MADTTIQASTPIAVAAGDLDGLPGDSADRIIYASALIGGLPLITKTGGSSAMPLRGMVESPSSGDQSGRLSSASPDAASKSWTVRASTHSSWSAPSRASLRTSRRATT